MVNLVPFFHPSVHVCPLHLPSYAPGILNEDDVSTFFIAWLRRQDRNRHLWMCVPYYELTAIRNKIEKLFFSVGQKDPWLDIYALPVQLYMLT